MTIQRFWRKNRFTILLEFASIFIGVLLALALNQWNQERMAINTSKSMMQQLMLEVKKNSDLVSGSVESLNIGLPELVDALKLAEEQHKLGLITQLSNTRFNYQMSLLDDSIWQLSLMRGSTNYISVNQAQLLFRVYRAQEYITEANKRLSTFMLEYSNSIQDTQKLIAGLQEIQGVQVQLLPLYDEILKEFSY
jgi:hypothetical protein